MRRGSVSQSLEVEIDQGGSSDSEFRMLGRSLARWKTKSSSQLSDGAVGGGERE